MRFPTSDSKASGEISVNKESVVVKHGDCGEKKNRGSYGWGVLWPQYSFASYSRNEGEGAEWDVKEILPI